MRDDHNIAVMTYIDLYMKLRLHDIGQNSEIVSLKTVKTYTIYQKQGIYLTFLDHYGKEKRQTLRATRDLACFCCETLWSKVSYIAVF